MYVCIDLYKIAFVYICMFRLMDGYLITEIKLRKSHTNFVFVGIFLIRYYNYKFDFLGEWNISCVHNLKAIHLDSVDL